MRYEQDKKIHSKYLGKFKAKVHLCGEEAKDKHIEGRIFQLLRTAASLPCWLVFLL